MNTAAGQQAFDFIFSAQGLGAFFEILLVGLMLVYVLFAFILVRQIRLMNKTFSTPLATRFRIAGIVHFLIAVVLTVLAILSI